MTHLKLANSQGPTSKYPERNKWGKIGERHHPTKTIASPCSQLTQKCCLGSDANLGQHHQLTYNFNNTFKSYLINGSSAPDILVGFANYTQLS
jgi:hypothetical protein